jgi:hypothetical protein
LVVDPAGFDALWLYDKYAMVMPCGTKFPLENVFNIRSGWVVASAGHRLFF